MRERNVNWKIKSDWKTIKSTGCPEIQEAIAGRNSDDVDPEMIEWMADFVRTSPKNTQAAPKTGKVST
jgi:hypothetical protein